MLLLFSPIGLGVALVSLVAGAIAGDYLARNAPNQRRLIGYGVVVMLITTVVTGFNAEVILTSGLAANGGGVTAAGIRLLVLMGLFIGMNATIWNRERQAQMLAVITGGVIGLPILLNISFGIGISRGFGI